MPPTMLPAGKAFFTKAASSRNSTVLHFILLILPHVHFLLCLILLLLKYSSSCSSPCFFSCFSTSSPFSCFSSFLLLLVLRLHHRACVCASYISVPASRAQKQQKQQKAQAAKEAAKTQMNSQLWKAKINFFERKSLRQHICVILTI